MKAHLVVISGPNKGAAYFLKEGKNTLGRGNEMDIVLAHGEVSKFHCEINLYFDSLELKDNNSSNGTFVNGSLVKKKALKHRERVSVGPFVLEVIASSRVNAEAKESIDPTSEDILEQPLNISEPKEEKSLFKKLVSRFDEIVSPVIYDLNTRHDWIVLLSGLFLLYVVLNIGMSVYPLLESAKESVVQEAEQRASYIVRQVADRNRDHIVNEKEGLLEVSFVEKDLSVKEIFIVSLKGRILAPGERINEMIDDPDVVKALKYIKAGDQRSWGMLKKRREEQGEVLVTFPITVHSSVRAINVPKALVVLRFDLRKVSLDMGTIGVIYFQSLAIALLLGIVFIYLVRGLTSNMLLRLNDDIDEVLKGNESTVPKRYKLSVLDKLIDSINAVFSRLPDLKSSDSEEIVSTDNEQQIIENFMAPLQFLVTSSMQSILLVSDQQSIIALSHSFEDLSGIHADTATGASLEKVVRDDALMSLLEEMMEKSMSAGLEGVVEEYEFSSGLHKFHCLAVYSVNEKVEAYLFIAEKIEEEGMYG